MKYVKMKCFIFSTNLNEQKYKQKQKWENKWFVLTCNSHTCMHFYIYIKAHAHQCIRLSFSTDANWISCLLQTQNRNDQQWNVEQLHESVTKKHIFFIVESKQQQQQLYVLDFTNGATWNHRFNTWSVE